MDIFSSNGVLLATTTVAVSEKDSVVNVTGEGMPTEGGMVVDAMGTEVKDPLLSSWPFVIGISVAVLAVSVALGVLLAKRRIKKGIELYED
jgi:ABC-type uncharacterized transport system permease subunit